MSCSLLYALNKREFFLIDSGPKRVPGLKVHPLSNGIPIIPISPLLSIGNLQKVLIPQKRGFLVGSG